MMPRLPTTEEWMLFMVFDRKCNEGVRCGNECHPNGAWHIAEPPPLSSQWGERLRQRWRRVRYGCGCPKQRSV